jgi:phosphoribosylaminoimidazolecarboxamide formyltransferase/IMP cyclohydrolase
MPKIRRALLTASDKREIERLGKALADSGAELVATGRTAKVLEAAGLKITPIEEVSGSPEAFQGRMKTLSFPVCSGILYRRGDDSDQKDLDKLSIVPIDCVVVNFYPFEEAVASGKTGRDLIEQIDIGGPTLVRSAAKNAPDTVVLTDPNQYEAVISELESGGEVTETTSERLASEAWQRIHAYDRAIQDELGSGIELRYGENPHQSAKLELDADSPIGWDEQLTEQALSYNNILDLSAAYGVASDLTEFEGRTGVVIVKHNNPCGVALVPRSEPEAQKLALMKAWEGDPVSAFGGVLVFTDPIEDDTADWLSERFVELVAAPELSKDSSALKKLSSKRKRLKAVPVRRWKEFPSRVRFSIPGGTLVQAPDTGLADELKSVTATKFSKEDEETARFGISVCRALKSNALALVRRMSDLNGALQLVGAGQGQPNRVEALKYLAIPRAQAVLRESGGRMEDLILVSDAFFPFRDTVDTAKSAGIRKIVQPGGSIKDKESKEACDESGVAMVLTGVRHFRH